MMAREYSVLLVCGGKIFATFAVTVFSTMTLVFSKMILNFFGVNRKVYFFLLNKVEQFMHLNIFLTIFGGLLYRII